MNKLITLAILLISFSCLAQAPKRNSSDTLTIQLSSWEQDQLINFDKIENRKIEIRNSIDALNREYNLLDDKEKSTWGAIYNAHQIDPLKVQSLISFEPQNKKVKIKIQP